MSGFLVNLKYGFVQNARVLIGIEKEMTRSELALKNWQNPEYRQKQIIAHTGKHFTEQHKRKISEGNKGKIRRKNLEGKKIGRLLITKYVGLYKRHESLWLCLCDCGNKKIIRGAKITSGETKSCGCLKREMASKRARRGINFKHGDSRKGKQTRLYKIWNDMKLRCNYIKNDNYKWYGGRGISICLKWEKNYLAFKRWALSHGYKDNLTIDRINSHGNYEPDNCQWISQSENTRKQFIK